MTIVPTLNPFSGNLQLINSGGGGGGSPAGNSGDVQVNISGSFGTGASDSIFWDNTNELLGIQTAGVPLAAGHFKSTQSIPLGNAGTPTGVTNAESLISAPSGDSVTQATPLTVGTYNGSATPNYGTGNYIANGATYNYTAINYYFDGVTTWYSPVQTVASFTDDNSGNPFNVSFSWSATPTGGNYTGTLLGLNGAYYNAGAIGSSGSINDDGSGSPYNWGSSGGPGTASPDFVANNTTYTFDVWGIGTSPSGHSYYILGDSPTFTDANNGYPFRLNLVNANGIQVKFHGTVGSSIYKNINASSSFTLQTNSSSDSSTLTPNSYGYPTDGTGATPNYYRAVAYRIYNSTTFYSTPSAFSSPNFDDPINSWYSTVTFSSASNASGYIIEYSTDGTTGGITKSFDNGNSTTLQDDNLTTWIGGAVAITPVGYLVPALIAAKDTASITDTPTAIIQSLNVTTPSPYTSFQNSNNGELIGFGYDYANLTAYLKSNAYEIRSGTSTMTFFPNNNVNLSSSAGIIINSANQTFIGSNGTITLATSGLSGSQFVLSPLTGITVKTSLVLPYSAKTGTYTITIGDYTIDCTANTFTVTLPQVASNDAPTGRIFIIKNTGTGTITVATAVGDTIDGGGSKTLLTNQSITVQATTTVNWIIIA